jgi:hypothetical protein
MGEYWHGTGCPPSGSACRRHRRAQYIDGLAADTGQGHEFFQRVRGVPPKRSHKAWPRGDESLRLVAVVPRRPDDLLNLRAVGGGVVGGGVVAGEQHPGDLVDLPAGGPGGQDRCHQQLDRRGEVQLDMRIGCCRASSWLIRRARRTSAARGRPGSIPLSLMRRVHLSSKTSIRVTSRGLAGPEVEPELPGLPVTIREHSSAGRGEGSAALSPSR